MALTESHLQGGGLFFTSPIDVCELSVFYGVLWLKRRALDGNLDRTWPDILSDLDDQFIQKMLSHVKEIREFYIAAKLNDKFLENAKKIYPLQFDVFYISPFKSNFNLELEFVPDFLSQFGPLIKSIVWDNLGVENAEDTEYFNMISKICGETLIELIVDGHDIDFSIPFGFRALEIFEMGSGILSNFGSIPTLNSLKLSSVLLENFQDKQPGFPKLESVSFSEVFELTDDIFIKFGKLSPQIKGLTIGQECGKVTTNVLQDIGDRWPLIEQFHFWIFDSSNENLTKNITNLSALRNIKSLHLNFQCSLKALFESFVENNVPIEDLEIAGHFCDYADVLPKLNHLTKLCLDGFPKEIAIKLIDEIPNLTVIRVRAKEISTIIQILELGENLTYVHAILSCSLNLDEYNAILSLVENRVQLCIEMWRKCDVTDDVMDKNKMWIVVEKNHWLR